MKQDEGNEARSIPYDISICTNLLQLKTTKHYKMMKSFAWSGIEGDLQNLEEKRSMPRGLSVEELANEDIKEWKPKVKDNNVHSKKSRVCGN